MVNELSLGFSRMHGEAADNVFNRVNLFNPQGNTSRTLFGRSTAARQSREIQLGAKFLF